MDSLDVSPPDLPAVLLSRDLGSSAVRSGLRTGRLLRVRPGAYVAVVPDEPARAAARRAALARCVAVSRQLGPDHVLSHTSAALLHGCWLWRPDPVVHVCRRARAVGARAPMVRRHDARLPEGDVTTVNGLQVTTLERTIEDCATSLHPRDALVVADSAFTLLVRPDRWARVESDNRTGAVRHRLETRLETRAGSRWVSRARAVLRYADPFAESPPESVLRWIVVSRGLPRPIAQLRTETARGTAFSDLGWLLAPRGAGTPTMSIHAEFDGRVKYAADAVATSARTVVAEKLREDALREAGGRVVRFVYEDLRDEEATFSRLCRLFPPSVLRDLSPVPELLAAGLDRA